MADPHSCVNPRENFLFRPRSVRSRAFFIDLLYFSSVIPACIRAPQARLIFSLSTLRFQKASLHLPPYIPLSSRKRRLIPLSRGRGAPCRTVRLLCFPYFSGAICQVIVPPPIGYPLPPLCCPLFDSRAVPPWNLCVQILLSLLSPAPDVPLFLIYGPSRALDHSPADDSVLFTFLKAGSFSFPGGVLWTKCPPPTD